MKTAKWIIIFITASVGAYIIYSQKIAEEEQNKELDKPKEGIQVHKRYDDNGNIKSDAQYLNGDKHGVAHNYYTDGAVHSEINYVSNVKEGISTWFFEDGKPYRITPFKAGKKQGVQTKYYKSGKLMAEIPYENGVLLEGTKEYFESGKLIKKYPQIKTKDRDLTLLGAKYVVEVKLSEKSRSKEFYIIRKNGRKQMARLNDKNVYEFSFVSVPNNPEFKEVTIYAKIKSKLNNPIILKKNIRIVLGG